MGADIRAELHRTKRQLQKQLLRIGFIYDGEKKLWTKARREWMAKLEFRHELQKETFSQY
jgi:hypothetical protein